MAEAVTGFPLPLMYTAPESVVTPNAKQAPQQLTRQAKAIMHTNDLRHLLISSSPILSRAAAPDGVQAGKRVPAQPADPDTGLAPQPEAGRRAGILRETCRPLRDSNAAGHTASLDKLLSCDPVRPRCRTSGHVVRLECSPPISCRKEGEWFIAERQIGRFLSAGRYILPAIVG